MDDRIKKALRLLISLLVSVGILWFVLTKADLSGLVRAVAGADLKWLLLAIVLSVTVNILIAGLQWQVYLRYLGLPLSFGENVMIKSALYVLRLVFPSKSGDLARALYLKAKHGFAYSSGVSATLFLVGANAGVLVAMGFVGALVGEGLDSKITRWTGIATVIMLAGFFVFRSIKPKGEGKVAVILARFHESFGLPFRQVLHIVGIGFFAFTVLNLTFYSITRAFDVQIPLLLVSAYIPLILIAGNLPGTLMGIGTREAATVWLLAGWASPETLLACGLAMTAVDKLLSVAIGAFYFPRFAAVAFARKTRQTQAPEILKPKSE